MMIWGQGRQAKSKRKQIYKDMKLDEMYTGAIGLDSMWISHGDDCFMNWRCEWHFAGNLN